jgi:mannose-6-phosphate isomerase-like protein (cupin superfamily)
MKSAIRRVVTGTSGKRSRIHDDGLIEPIMVSPLPGYAWHRIWSLDQPPADPPDPQDSNGHSHFPPPGGVRFTIYTVPPQGTGPAVALTAAAERELERSLPGRSSYMETSQDGMHRTPSLDLICVLSGEIWLELDDGEVHLRQGDCIVQNGARHAWRNRSDSPCSMAIVLIGV